MKELFDIQSIAFTWLGYDVSYVELIGTLFGLISVYFATRPSILTWPTGIVNEIFLFILFFQVQLYADMFLQVYFFIVTVYGWYCWRNGKQEFSITTLPSSVRIYILVGIVLATAVVGLFIKNIHLYLPHYFKIPAAYPMADSFVMVLSIVATVLLAKKKLENWVLWITVDIACVALFARKEVYFLSLEYVIFLGMATFGLIQWKKQLRHD